MIFKLYFQKQQAYTLLVKKNLESVENEQKCWEQTQKSEIGTNRDVQKFKQNMPNELTHRILSDLQTMIESDKIWLDPDLNLNEVAKRLNTNTAYLSKVINEHLNTNFTTYINEHRVKEARRMLADLKYSHLTIEGISGLVGFNSKSAFNVAFRKFTGLTPSIFQQQVNRLKDKNIQMN